MSSSSPFDDLLGFGDNDTTATTTTTTTTTTRTIAYSTFDDDFDPFSPSSSSPHDDQTSPAGRESGMLLDFSTEAQVQNGGNLGELDFNTSSIKNPFHNMSSGDQSSSAQYDWGDTEPANPLYHLDSQLDTNDSSNPLYELSSVTTTVKTESAGNPLYELSSVTTTEKTRPPGNPLYNVYDDDNLDEAAEEVDLLSGTNELQEEGEEEEEGEDGSYEHPRHHHHYSQEEHFQDDSEVHEVEEEETAPGQVKVVTLEYQSTALNGDSRHRVRDVAPDEEEEEEEEQRRSSDEEPRHYPGHVTIIEEACTDEEDLREEEEESVVSQVQPQQVRPHHGRIVWRDTDPEEDPVPREAEDDNRTSGEEDELPEDVPHEGAGAPASDSFSQYPFRGYSNTVQAQPEEYHSQVVKEEDDDDGWRKAGDSGGQREPTEGIYGVFIGTSGQPFEDIDRFTSQQAEEDLEKYCLNRKDSDDIGLKRSQQAEGFIDDQSNDLEKYCLNRKESDDTVLKESEQAEGCVDDRSEQDLEKYCLDREESDDMCLKEGDDDDDDAGCVGDQAEEDLERYCVDREESDVTDYPENEIHKHVDTWRSREETGYPGSGVETLASGSRGFEPATSSAVVVESDVEAPRGDRTPSPRRKPRAKEMAQEEEVVDGGRTVTKTTRTETTYQGGSQGSENVQTSKDYSSNHWNENRHREEADFGRHTREQDIHFNEVSSTRSKPDSYPSPAPRKQQIDFQQEILTAEGGVYESQPQVFHQWQNEPDEEGVFENRPQKREDVVREADSDKTADLPPVGTAQSMRAKFMSVQQESSTTTSHPRHEITHSSYSGRGEYVSEPRGYVEKYEGRPESGVFESQPVHSADVVRSGEEVKEELPEKGMAKNLANMFRQFSSETTTTSHAVRSKREITPERTASTRAEYASEPQMHHVNEYEVNVDAGVFENQPQRHVDVVTSDSVPEDYIPERGFAKNVAAKFQQIESKVLSPPLSPGRRKEFTPPREDNRSHQAVVAESTPDYKSDIVHSTDPLEETLPERGMAKNIAQLFRKMESGSGSKSQSSPKAKKEITPPPQDSGVYENQPRQFHAEYNRPAESGVIENEPVRRDDVVRGDEPPRYEEELPERGAARNLVNKWRQMESESAKLKSPSSAGRPKEFTPPREELRTSQPKKSPRTPMSPNSYGRLDNGSVHPSDLPEHYQPQSQEFISESNPEHRPDVVREGDTDWQDGMPKKDTARKMLARFQSIQAEASKPAAAHVSRKDLDTPTKTARKDSLSSDTEHSDFMDLEKANCDDDNKVGRSKSMRAAIQMEKCGACDKTVYAMERLEMNKRVYHKACFRCSQCKAVLTPKTFAINNEVIFCTTHYKQLFATKGNYDEGFGRTQHKKRWSSNPNLAKDGDEDSTS